MFQSENIPLPLPPGPALNISAPRAPVYSRSIAPSPAPVWTTGRRTAMNLLIIDYYTIYFAVKGMLQSF